MSLSYCIFVPVYCRWKYSDRYVQRTSHMVQRKEFLQNNQHPADELSSKNVFKE